MSAPVASELLDIAIDQLLDIAEEVDSWPPRSRGQVIVAVADLLAEVRAVQAVKP